VLARSRIISAFVRYICRFACRLRGEHFLQDPQHTLQRRWTEPPDLLREPGVIHGPQLVKHHVTGLAGEAASG
jgi:hypothetical protein